MLEVIWTIICSITQLLALAAIIIMIKGYYRKIFPRLTLFEIISIGSFASVVNFFVPSPLHQNFLGYLQDFLRYLAAACGLALLVMMGCKKSRMSKYLKE
jgi:hypothetical protein